MRAKRRVGLIKTWEEGVWAAQSRRRGIAGGRLLRGQGCGSQNGSHRQVTRTAFL